MTIQVEFWSLLLFLVGLLLSFLGASFAAGRLLLAQVEKRLQVQFSAQEQSRTLGQRHWDERFAAIERVSREEAEQWQRVERDFMQFKADMPLNYVRREDYIRGQSVIEAKLDGLAVRIENVTLKGVKP